MPEKKTNKLASKNEKKCQRLLDTYRKQEILDGTGISYYIETVIMISVRISIILNRRITELHTLLNLYVSKCFCPYAEKYWLFYFFILREWTRSAKAGSMIIGRILFFLSEKQQLSE